MLRDPGRETTPCRPEPARKLRVESGDLPAKLKDAEVERPLLVTDVRVRRLGLDPGAAFDAGPVTAVGGRFWHRRLRRALGSLVRTSNETLTWWRADTRTGREDAAYAASSHPALAGSLLQLERPSERLTALRQDEVELGPGAVLDEHRPVEVDDRDTFR